MQILMLALDVDLATNRGEAIHVRSLAKALAAGGHSVSVIVGSSPHLGNLEGFEVSARASARDPLVLTQVLKAARKSRPEVLYERRFSPKISAAAASILGIPYVVEFNGLPDEEMTMQDRKPPAGRLEKVKRRLRLRGLRGAAAVVTVSAALRRAVIERYGLDASRVYFVPNGVDDDRFFVQAKGAARSRLGLGPGHLAMFVGNIVRWHGLENFVDALSLAEEVKAVIVGDGPDRERVRARARERGILDRMIMTGEVDHQKVPEYLAAADIGVAPFTASRNKVVGSSALKILEYLACGRPVVTTEIEGAVELIKEFGCGVVVPPDDPVSLAEGLKRVARDRSFEQAALAASETIRTRHSWKTTAQRTTEVLARSLAYPPPSRS